MLRGERTQLVVEVFLHPAHAFAKFAQPVVKLLDLAGQPAKGILNITHTLIERGNAGVLRLFALEARGFFLVALAEQLRDLNSTRARGDITNLLGERGLLRLRSSNPRAEILSLRKRCC